MDLTGKVCVVTGVSRGIGLATVQMLLDKDAVVIGVGRTNPNINNDRFEFHTCDIRNHEAVESTVKSILSSHPAVDVLINNAGLGYFGYIEETTIEQWKKMYETNVDGLFYMTKYLLPQMKEREHGHVINIASTAGLEGYPQVAAYCGTKHAVRAISESMYKELREFNVKVTCVYPGSVKTDFFNNTPAIDAHDWMLMPTDVATLIVNALETPDNCHQVNLELRPLHPKGRK
jgi:NADP-dependent 3-hydroxy acid dehydrogenase YdfG